MNVLTDSERELVALGAAIASNCVPCIEHHIPEARKAGLGDPQIQEAVGIADRVRRVPARKVMQAARAQVGERPNGSAPATGAGCGCTDASPPERSGLAV